MFEFQKDLAEIEKQHGIEYIKLEFDSENDFYNALMEMQRYTNDNTAFYGTSRSGRLDVVVESEKSDDDDDEETTTTSTLGKRKKKKATTNEEPEVEEMEEMPEIEVDDTTMEEDNSFDDTSDE